MGGNVLLNGSYSTADPKTPTFNAGLKMTDLGFAQTYKELNMVKQLAPVFEHLKGTYSGSLNIDTQLDQAMSPVLQTMTGNGSLSTRDLNLSGVKSIDLIADAIKKPGMKDLSVKDMNLDFTIDKGRVSTKPFDIKLGDYNLNLSRYDRAGPDHRLHGQDTAPVIRRKDCRAHHLRPEDWRHLHLAQGESRCQEHGQPGLAVCRRESHRQAH